LLGGAATGWVVGDTHRELRTHDVDLVKEGDQVIADGRPFDGW